MRTVCDVCESAAAILFCAADEAALCRSCDEKVHMCNKLASRHVRVGLAEPSAVPRCDICEIAPGIQVHFSSFQLFERLEHVLKYIYYWTSYVAFFYCEKDGSSLCLQCDMMVHVGGKRTHGRYLLLRQRVEFPGDKSSRLDEPGSQQGDLGEAKRESIEPSNFKGKENEQNHRASSIPMLANNSTHDGEMENKLIDLNTRPQQMHGLAPNNQEQVDTLIGNHDEDASLVPDGYFKSEPKK